MTTTDICNEAAKKLGEIGEPALNILTQALHKDNIKTHSEIVRQLGKIGQPALNALAQALHHGSSYIRKVAISELGKLGEPALDALTRALDDEDVEVRKAAVSELGKLGEPALDALTRALDDEDVEVREAAVWSLEVQGEPALDALTRALDDKDVKVRKAAVWMLGKIGEPAIDALAQALNDDDKYVLKEAVEELSRIGEAALEILSQAYDDKNPEIRYKIIEGLPLSEESIGILTKAIDDPDPDTGAQAVRVALRIGFSVLRPVVLATEATNGEVAELAVSSLAKRLPNEYYYWGHFTARYFPKEILERIVTVIVDDLIIRKSGRPAGFFNSEVVKDIFEGLIPQNPTLRTKIFADLSEIAYQHQDGPRQRAVAVARNLGHEEFAAVVKSHSSQNPQAAAQIMRELGGSEATAFFTEAQSQTLAEYRAPLIDLEETARQRWEALTLEARRSSTASKWMSIGVFIVGTVVVMWAFILLTLSDEPWQQLAAALAGVSSFLVMYTQRFWKEPVEQIQRFSAQQARLQIAFIGYMNRVAQIRLLFEDAYSKEKLTPETVADYQQWLETATDKAWQHLSDISLPDIAPPTPNNNSTQ